MREADPMEEMHLAPRFSVAEGRNQRLQLRACSFHVLVIKVPTTRSSSSRSRSAPRRLDAAPRHADEPQRRCQRLLGTKLATALLAAKGCRMRPIAFCWTIRHG